MKELYINKQRCDLNDKVSFALQFKSPIMATQDYLLQNRTSTIKLPSTANNRRIFEFINKTEAVSQMPYRKHRADYYVNGLQVINNGQATILAVSDTEIEVSIAWGFSLVFTELFNKSLRQLSIDNTFYWGDSTPVGGTPTNVYMPYCLPYGTDASKHNPWVKESFIIDKILGAYSAGVTDYGAYIYLPTRHKETIGLAGYMEANIMASYGLVDVQPMDSVTTDGVEYDPNEIYCYAVTSTIYGVTISVGIDDAENGFGVRALEVTSIDSLGVVEQVAYIEAEPYDEYGYAGYPATLSAYDITLEVGKRYRVRAASSYDTYSYWNISIAIGGGSNVSFGSYFPIAVNLPDMSCGDFIKAYMQRHNLFYDIDTDGVIKFVKIDDIFAKIDNGEIADWSDKVQSIDAVNFSLDGFAQKNICTYKEEESYGTSGAFAINSELLDKENTFVEVDLVPPPQNTGVVTIDHYTEGGAYKDLDEDIAYVCNVVEGDVDGTTTNIASFTLGEHAQTFDILIADYFTDFVAVVNQPKLFTATLHLTDNDIAGIKFNQPIFIRQTGQYCLIQSIDIRDNGATGTFIVLPHSPQADTPPPLPQGWSTRTDVSPSRAAAVAVAVGAEAYIIDGFTGTVSSLSSLTQVYNVDTDTWTNKASSPLARHSLGGGYVDGKIYVSGGRVNDIPQSRLDIYNISTDTWSTGVAMGTPASECAGTAVGDKVYILGGRASWGSPFNTIQVYDTLSQSWSSNNSMRTARRNFYVANWNERIAVAGGYMGSGGTANVETYDPDTLTYTTLPSLPSARWDNALAATTDALFTIGGESANGRLAEFLVYDANAVEWVELDGADEALSKAMLVGINGNVLLVGGDNGSSTFTQTKIYNP